MSATNKTDSAAHWDAFWGGSEKANLFGPALGEALAEFWTTLFESCFVDDRQMRVVDLACGDGDVLRHALRVAGSRPYDFVGVDYSDAAVGKLANLDDRLVGVAADVVRMPFEDGAFEIVTSQFGIEYAESEAYAEAARLVAPGGTLALALHLDRGALHDECRANLEATEEIIATRLLPLTGSVFRIGYDVLRGEKNSATLREAEAELRPATEQAKDTLRRFGEGVAGGQIVALLQGLGRIYAQLASCEPADALRWVENADAQLRSYARRLRAMTQAAVDDASLSGIVADLEDGGFDIGRSGTLNVGPNQQAAARILVANRPRA